LIEVLLKRGWLHSPKTRMAGSWFDVASKYGQRHDQFPNIEENLILSPSYF